VSHVEAFEISEAASGVSSCQAEEAAAGIVEGLSLLGLETTELVRISSDFGGEVVIPLDVCNETPIIKLGHLQSHGSKDRVFALKEGDEPVWE
jgi:hypothetical protein